MTLFISGVFIMCLFNRRQCIQVMCEFRSDMIGHLQSISRRWSNEVNTHRFFYRMVAWFLKSNFIQKPFGLNSFFCFRIFIIVLYVFFLFWIGKVFNYKNDSYFSGIEVFLWVIVFELNLPQDFSLFLLSLDYTISKCLRQKTFQPIF